MSRTHAPVKRGFAAALCSAETRPAARGGPGVYEQFKPVSEHGVAEKQACGPNVRSGDAPTPREGEVTEGEP